MDKTRSAASISLVFLVVVCISLLSVQNANSQSASITTTTTITQPPSGQCSEISLAFSAQAGKEIVGTFGSDTSVNFFILSQEDFSAIRNPKCSLPLSSKPLFSEMNSVGHDNGYRSLPFPANGTYYFVFVVLSGPTHLASGFATVELAFPASTILVTTEASATKISSNVSVTTTQSPTQSTASSQNGTAASSSLSLGTLGVIGLVVVVGLIASVMVFMKRGKSRGAQKALLRLGSEETGSKPESPPARLVTEGQNIPTGFRELDTVLGGGLPIGFAVLIVSPPFDERDLLFRRIVESSLSMGTVIFFLSRDLARIRDFASRYLKNFYVFSPQADKIIPPSGNVFKIQAVENLYDLNISFTKAVEALPETNAGKLIIIDLLSDILLEHKALTTRKWLDDFIAKRKAEGFTVLGVLNPMISSSQEINTVKDLFDGIIEIYEKEMKDRTRRFLIVKKMFGRKYVETELMLDKDKLFEASE